jgi:predicted metal-dependent peptidase
MESLDREIKVIEEELLILKETRRRLRRLCLEDIDPEETKHSLASSNYNPRSDWLQALMRILPTIPGPFSNKHLREVLKENGYTVSSRLLSRHLSHFKKRGMLRKVSGSKLNRWVYNGSAL